MGRQKGFTIIETTLFIVLSAVLAMMVLGGMNSALQNNRVTDTTRSLESFIELQLANVRSGTVKQQTAADGRLTCNGAQAYPGMSNSCVIIGKLLKFTTTSVASYNIVGKIDPDPVGCSAAATGVDSLKQYCPTVLDMGNPIETYQPEWGATLSRVTFQDTGGTVTSNPNVAAFMRDPASELVYTVVFSDTGTYLPADPADPLDLRSKILATYTNTKGTICMAHTGLLTMKTFVYFTGGEGAAAIRTSGDNATVPSGLQC